VTAAALALLLYEYGILHYSYAYHKFADNLSFLLIGAFARGVTLVVKGRAGSWIPRYVAPATVLFLATGSFVAAEPLIEQMKNAQFAVSPDLVRLTAIKQMARHSAIRVLEDRPWQQLWSVYFLDPVPIVLVTPRLFFINWINWTRKSMPVFQNVLTLLPWSPDASSVKYFVLAEPASPSINQLLLSPLTPSLIVLSGSGQKRVLWQNSTYLLLDSGHPWRKWLRLAGQTPDGWITSEGLTLDIPAEWIRLRPTLQLKGQAILFEYLGGKPSVSAKVYWAGRPQREVPATIEASAGRYRLRIELNSAGLPSHEVEEVHLAISFDKYFVPHELAVLSHSPDLRHLVIRLPDEVCLLEHPALQ
jgi:hypothetical protein